MTGFKSGASDDDPLGGEGDSDDPVVDDADSAVGDDQSVDGNSQPVGDGQSVDDSTPGDDDSGTSGDRADDLDLPLGEEQEAGESADPEGAVLDLANADAASGRVEVPDDVPTPTDGRLPWLFTRDSITDGRERTVQLHLQTATVERQRRVRSTLEDRLDDRVSKADLREAALLVGLADPDGVAAVLKAWGYGAE
jgi:hypothetical protein